MKWILIVVYLSRAGIHHIDTYQFLTKTECKENGEQIMKNVKLGKVLYKCEVIK